MLTDLRHKHTLQLQTLQTSLAGNTKRLRVKKKTISNLFRYDGRTTLDRREVDLSQFTKALYLDLKKQTLDIQGLATFESIVDFVLPHGFMPIITLELKHITIGGAIVGIGIESNTYRYGFVHNSLLEADVLLPDGRILTCSATNHYSDLFHALPNSYGTLGYILRAKIKLRKIKPYMKLTTKRFDQISHYLAALKTAESDRFIETIEGLAYAKNDLYLTTGKQTEKTDNLITIYGGAQFYKDISQTGIVSLPIKEYLFRYDPEWFWNMPETNLFQLFRRFAPTSIKNSAFYTRYANLGIKLPFIENAAKSEQFEHLIQDWEVPWKHAKSLLDFIFDTIDLNGKPLMSVLVKVPLRATCYPMKENQLYLNVGSYSFIKKKPKQTRYHATKEIDKFCFNHEGIKMLYSTTFVSKPEFDRIYNGKAYAKLKKKYDPLGLVPTLYEKAVQGR